MQVLLKIEKSNSSWNVEFDTLPRKNDEIAIEGNRYYVTRITHFLDTQGNNSKSHSYQVDIAPCSRLTSGYSSLLST